MPKQKLPSAVPCPVCGALMFPPNDVDVYTGRWWELVRSGKTTCPVCSVTFERKRKKYQKRIVQEYMEKECAKLIAQDRVLKPEHFQPGPPLSVVRIPLRCKVT